MCMHTIKERSKQCSIINSPDLGGGGGAHPARAPPLLKPKKTKNKQTNKHINVSEHSNVSDFPPPPRLGLVRLWTLVALRKKSVGVPPPPPPRSSAFLGLARLSRLAADRKKNLGSAPEITYWLRKIRKQTFTDINFIL